MPDQEGGTISRNIVRRPESGNPGTAGYGVAYDSGAPDGERFRIEQLWPPGPDEDTGRAEPVYVHEDAALELAKAIIDHYKFEVVERGE